MNQEANIFLKALSSLAGPKACIKYLFSALGIIFSYKYILKYVTDYGVPDNYTPLVLMFIGIGSGALLGEILFFVLKIIFALVKDFYGNIKTEKENKVRTEKEDAKFLSKFTISLPHLEDEQLRQLRELIKEDTAYHRHKVKDLEANKYIIRLSVINGDKCLYKINPSISDMIHDHYHNEIEVVIDEFMEQITEQQLNILELLKEDNPPALNSISYYEDIVNNFEGFSFIRHSYYFAEDGMNGNVNFFIKEEYQPYLESKLNMKFKSVLSISHKYLIEVTATIDYPV